MSSLREGLDKNPGNYPHLVDKGGGGSNVDFKKNPASPWPPTGAGIIKKNLQIAKAPCVYWQSDVFGPTWYGISSCIFCTEKQP